MIEYDEDEPMSAIMRAENELRRVDHLIYVSLKYTRTVDVIKNIIHRLINTYDFIIEDMLQKLEHQGVIYEIPTAPGLRIKLAKDNYLSKFPELQDFFEFYTLLRQLDKCQYTALREFRRHVTMNAELPNGDTVEVNIDVITEYYNKTKEYVKLAKERLYSSKE